MKFIRQAMIAVLGISITGIGSVSFAQEQDFEQVEIQTVPYFTINA